jgi:hypothetical protein
MNTEHLEAFARGLGALPAAVEDVVRRAVNHFGDTTPDHDTLTAWGTQLRTTCTHLFVAAPQDDLAAVAARHGMSAALWQSLSPTERYTRERNLQPPVAKQRPQPVTLRPEQLAALAQMTPSARLSAYRQLQAEQKG